MREIYIIKWKNKLKILSWSEDNKIFHEISKEIRIGKCLDNKISKYFNLKETTNRKIDKKIWKWLSW